MCGIVGLISRSVSGFTWSEEGIFTNMLRADTVRGDDSTGVFGVSRKGHVDTQKGDADGYIFTRVSQYDQFRKRMRDKYHIVIGHNRKATKGTVTSANAHPFVEGNIVLVHNGTLLNAGDINKEVEVDSHAIAHALNDHDAVAALGKLDGAYALVWYNMEDRTLNLARNAQRPLFVLEYPGVWAIASEAGLPAWLFGREGVKFKQAREVLPEKILTWHLDKLTDEPEVTAFAEYKAPTHYPTVYKGPVYDSGWESRGHRGYGYSYPRPDPTGPIFEKKAGGNFGGFRTGDVIRVKFDDDKTEANQMIYMGHPIIDGELHEDICVQYTCPLDKTDEFLKAYTETDVFSGNVTAHSIYRGTQIIYVTNVLPVKRVRSVNGDVYDLGEATRAISEGCPRCKMVIPLDHFGLTLVKRRSDGTHRVVCRDCLTKAIEASEQNNTTITEGIAVVH